VRRYKVPLLVVGGGGYTLRNVARCWAYETGRLMGHDLPDNLPESVLNSFNYYMDNQRLRIEVNINIISSVDIVRSDGQALQRTALMQVVCRLCMCAHAR
jgi:histone deacetylase 1/2